MTPNEKGHRKAEQEAVLAAWWCSPAGGGLLAATRRVLAAYVPRLQARRILYLGSAPIGLAAEGLVCVPYWQPLEMPADVVADADALPFAADSFDLIILPYLLERCNQPDGVLNECYRVLQPEGKLLILALNPHSLLSVMRRWHVWREDAHWPWRQPFHAATQTRRLLAAADFEVREGRFFQYRLPLLPWAWQARWQWLDDAGDRWWPTGANAYLLLAQRREPGWIPPELIRPRYAPAMPSAGMLRSGNCCREEK